MRSVKPALAASLLMTATALAGPITYTANLSTLGETAPPLSRDGDHSTQYGAQPEFDVDRLRKESPEKYESYVDLELGSKLPVCAARRWRCAGPGDRKGARWP